MRTLAIWLFGGLATAIVGGFIGASFDTSFAGLGWPFGVIAGAFVFVCLRLWLSASSRRLD